MRALINIIAGVLAITLVAGAWLHIRADEEGDNAIQDARAAISKLKRETRLRAATARTDINGRGHPITIDPAWFNGAVPLNPFSNERNPWLEVALPEHAELLHPHIRLILDADTAAFWYNPANGIIRARVPMGVSDRSVTDLYNQINTTSLASIFEQIDPNRPLQKSPLQDLQADAVLADAQDEYSEENMDPTKPHPDDATPHQ